MKLGAVRLLCNLNGVLALVLMGALTPGVSSAQNSNEDEIRTLLINKLNNVYLKLPNEDATKQGLTLRIADLLSERARTESRAELSQGCTVCNKGSEDRVRALQLYREALPKVSSENIGRVLTQIGHLYELTGNEAGAVKTYNKIIADNHEATSVAEAQLSLAELYFKKNNYKLARSYYEKVFQSEAKVSKGLAAYRLAWCDFREGRTQAAALMAQKILSTPELLNRSSQVDVASIDVQFQEEVAADYVTFLAQNKANENAAQLVYDLSPAAAKLNHVLALAVELERLGMRSNSISVWRFLQEKENRPLQRLEGYVRLSQLEMEQKNLEVASDDYNRALLIWPDVCANVQVGQESICKELGTRIKNFAIDWYKMEQKNPSAMIYTVYVSYLKVFPKELNLQLQAATIAKFHKNWTASVLHFKNATEIIIEQKANDKLENVLLNHIEVAELSKDNQLLGQALSYYLQNSLSRSVEIKVRYQLAKLEYDKGNFDIASQKFREVAVTPGATFPDLKEKAADLALDALVLLKDEKRLEPWAREFAKVLPQHKQNYLAIANRSVLNRSVGLASASPEKALDALKSIDRKVLKIEEQVDICKNIIILAEKIQKFDEARRATNELLLISSLKPEDRNFALEHKIYLAELTLDFQTAFNASKELTAVQGDLHWLKMALLAELAGQPSKSYYLKYIDATQDQKKAEAIVLKLIKDSADSIKEIALHKKRLSQNPDRLATLYLEAYAKSKDKSIIQLAEKDNQLKATFGYKALVRQNILKDFSSKSEVLSKHQIDSSSQKKLAQTIKARGQLLKDFESFAKRAIDLEDFTSQVLVLNLMGIENKRFYDEVLSLPLPEGLTPEEQGQYLQLLSQQAGPHQVRAQDLELKVNEFWGNKVAIEAIFDVYPKQLSEVRELFKPEVALLAQIAPAQYKNQLEHFWDKPAAVISADKVDFKIVEQARSDLRQDPLNINKVEKLLGLERGFGDSAMVSYLESRLANLQVKDIK